MQRASSVVVFDAQAERGQALVDQLRAEGYAGARTSTDWATLEPASVELLVVRGAGVDFVVEGFFALRTPPEEALLVAQKRAAWAARDHKVTSV